MANNTVGKMVKNLKAFLNSDFLRSKGIELSVNLSEWKVRKEKPLIIYLEQDELQKLVNFDLSKNKKLDKVRDLFVLQCSTGLRYSDLIRLAPAHLQGSTIKMKAHKNKKLITIPLTPVSFSILEKYDFDLQTNLHGMNRSRKPISEQKMNDYIKILAEEAGINDPIETVEYKGGQKTYKTVPKHSVLSTHKGVSTFITHCGEKGISAKLVSEITGKTVKVILDHYYGTSVKTIEKEMERAFGKVAI
jgi:integrase